MPVMNGLAAANILKELVPQIPLFLFTSFGAVLNSENLRRAGFSALIGKNDAGKLVITAQTLLSRL
jgi:CheY-like chemotaxis protein